VATRWPDLEKSRTKFRDFFPNLAKRFVFFVTRSETIQKRWFLAQNAPKGMGFHPIKIYSKRATQSPDITKSRNQFRDFLKNLATFAFWADFLMKKIRPTPEKWV